MSITIPKKETLRIERNFCFPRKLIFPFFAPHISSSVCFRKLVAVARVGFFFSVGCGNQLSLLRGKQPTCCGQQKSAILNPQNLFLWQRENESFGNICYLGPRVEMSKWICPVTNRWFSLRLSGTIVCISGRK